MLRWLWPGVWDAQPHAVAMAMAMALRDYGSPPYTLMATDLPPEVTEPYVFPYLTASDRQWDDLATALSWGREMFGELGLIQH
jgi:hypothetical protein